MDLPQSNLDTDPTTKITPSPPPQEPEEDKPAHMLNSVGIDIGGTSVKLGVVDTEGKVLIKGQKVYEGDARGPDDVVDQTLACLYEALEKVNLTLNDIESIGVCCPGKLEDGVICKAANFPQWKDVPLERIFTERLNKPVFLCNDADAAILAEKWVGSAKDPSIHDFAMFTLGTGVGCSLMVNRELVQGSTGTIEGGHMIVERNGRPCGCSQFGCIEAYASATALIKEAKRRLVDDPTSKLHEHPIDKIDAKIIFELAGRDDKLCIDVVDEVADYLGFACVNLCRVLDCQLIVLAGGVAEAGESFVNLVTKAFRKYSWKAIKDTVKIEKSTAGYDAGLIGCAAAGRRALAASSI